MIDENNVYTTGAKKKNSEGDQTLKVTSLSRELAGPTL